MTMNMKQWVADILASDKKKSLPVLSFPSIQKMGITVSELINSSDKQAEGMKIIADSCPTAASVSLMDLSLEAEAFGSTIRVSDDEVPTVIGSIVSTEEEAEALKVPEIGAGRTQIYIDAIEKACKLITDRPVLAGVIGPFSLAGRLLDVSEALIYCYDEPDMVHIVLQKVTEFLINYCNEYKKVGANGIVMAEPLAGLLSPDLAQEFSADYCSFAIWRNIGGHQVTLAEAKELCEKGITSTELEMYREDGAIYRKRLGVVSPDKLQIVKI